MATGRAGELLHLSKSKSRVLAITVPIRDSFDPILPSDLAQLELELGSSLPQDYKAFLLRHNGGYFEDEVRYPYLEPCPYGDFGIIRGFLGLNVGYDYADIRDHIKVLIDWNIASDLMPIGDDIFGNPICISIEGRTYGKAFFWYSGMTKREC